MSSVILLHQVLRLNPLKKDQQHPPASTLPCSMPVLRNRKARLSIISAHILWQIRARELGTTYFHKHAVFSTASLWILMSHLNLVVHSDDDFKSHFWPKRSAELSQSFDEIQQLLQTHLKKTRWCLQRPYETTAALQLLYCAKWRSRWVTNFIKRRIKTYFRDK